MTAWRRGKAQGSYPLQSLFLSAFEFAAFSLNKFTLYKLHRLSSYSRICQSRLKFISKWHRQLILYWADGMCPTCNPVRSFCFAHFWSQDVDRSLLLWRLRIQSVAPGSSLSRKLYLSLSPWITWMWSVFPDCRWNHDGKDQTTYNHSCSCNICIPELKIFGQSWFFWQRASQRCAQCNQPITAPRLFIQKHDMLKTDSCILSKEQDLALQLNTIWPIW